MMLRSSSTPVLGSLLSSISPDHHHDTTLHAYKSSPIPKLSFHQTLSCNSYPISGGIRRSQYEGNCESLLSSRDSNDDDEEEHEGEDDVEEKYKKMVNESPRSPLLLGNYARFLYQSKQDFQGAKEYYSRAIYMDPNDGEILSQYAKLLWELYQDKDQATSYFERAVRATSEDSHIHAAYACFLWELTEEEKDEDDKGYYSNVPSRPL